MLRTDIKLLRINCSVMLTRQLIGIQQAKIITRSVHAFYLPVSVLIDLWPSFLK